jgi:putative membrane protein
MFANIFVFIVAFIHIVISIIEMVFWNQRPVHEPLNFNDDEARKVAPIVANAGLYNGFLGRRSDMGLFWHNGSLVKLFFLACVIVAGIFGAVTLKWTTLVLQALPGAVALIFVWMSRTAS